MLKLRSVGAVCAAILLVLGLAPPASAHAVYTERMMTGVDQTRCLHNTSLIDDGTSGGGASLAETSAWFGVPDLMLNGCSRAAPEPAGWIASRMDLYLWSPKVDAWVVCREMKGWVLNKAGAYKVVATADWGAPCGPGYYATRTQSGMWTGTAWTGLCCYLLWSGHHWLPTSKPAQNQQVGPASAITETRPYWGDPDTHQVPGVGSFQSEDANGTVTTYHLDAGAFIAHAVP